MGDVCSEAEKYLMQHSKVKMNELSFIFARERVERTLGNAGMVNLPPATLDEVQPFMKRTHPGWPTCLKFATRKDAFPHVGPQTLPRYALGILRQGVNYRQHFLCFIRGQRSDITRNKARVVLGADTLDLILMMLLLLPVNVLALALCYDPVWPSTMGDSIFNGGPEKQMQKALCDNDGERVWFGRDLRAYDASIPASLLILAGTILMHTCVGALVELGLDITQTNRLRELLVLGMTSSWIHFPWAESASVVGSVKSGVFPTALLDGVFHMIILNASLHWIYTTQLTRAQRKRLSEEASITNVEEFADSHRFVVAGDDYRGSVLRVVYDVVPNELWDAFYERVLLIYVKWSGPRTDETFSMPGQIEYNSRTNRVVRG
eukprot:5400853-Amphidinium_carterae.1